MFPDAGVPEIVMAPVPPEIVVPVVPLGTKITPFQPPVPRPVIEIVPVPEVDMVAPKVLIPSPAVPAVELPRPNKVIFPPPAFNVAEAIEIPIEASGLLFPMA
ncbi:hypothetical protein PHIN5_13920 [Polynucleobacter sp. HIN5]|nr:hypothetical protein PHIN5_13920 [Polynucleobacter sp. HIN5]